MSIFKTVHLFLRQMAKTSFLLQEEIFYSGRNSLFYCEGGKALAWVSQRNCGCSIPESVQGQTGWCPEQHQMCLSPWQGDWNYRVFKVTSRPGQSVILFYDSMKLSYFSYLPFGEARVVIKFKLFET